MAVSGPSPSASREFLPSIALMRALAALVVIYDHLVGIWLERNGVGWRPARFLDTWLFEPFHIMAHGGGLAVAVFFLVSGFVIVYVGQRESSAKFAIRRALRIYPALWVSILLLLAAYSAVMLAGATRGLDEYAVMQVLRNPAPLGYIAAAMTLLNYIIGTPPINGVAWTLVVEVMFYAVVLALLPLFRTRPRTAILAAFALLTFLQVVAKTNSVVFLITINGVYVSYLFLGSLVYLRWAGRIGNAFLLVMSVAFAALFLHGVRAWVAQPPFTFADYGVSYGFAWLIFVCAYPPRRPHSHGRGDHLLLAHQLFALSQSRRTRPPRADAAVSRGWAIRSRLSLPLRSSCWSARSPIAGWRFPRSNGRAS